MVDKGKVLKSVDFFNNLKKGDRIFYTKNGHAMTRRVQKVGKFNAIVLEDGIERKVRYDRIFMA